MSDEAASEFEEGFVDVGSAFPADAEAFEAVEPAKTVFCVVRWSLG
ncbi:hypothetical protein ACIP6I_14090 [Streptomyces anulatus]